MVMSLVLKARMVMSMFKSQWELCYQGPNGKDLVNKSISSSAPVSLAHWNWKNTLRDKTTY